MGSTPELIISEPLGSGNIEKGATRLAHDATAKTRCPAVFLAGMGPMIGLAG